jgi:glycosyltransferase involved in cell wall biosynthesis
MWQNYLTGRHRIEIMLGYRNILVASAAMRSEFLCNGIEPDRLKVVRYPVSAPSAQTLPSTKPESQGGSGSGQFCSGQLRHLFFAGRMVALKGGEILLNALPRVATELDCSLTLTLAGDGPARPQWEAQARSVCEKQPSITVEFAGWLNATEMDRSLAGADLLVVPSLWPEPFGLIGPEAGMHGVPAAAFATGGISEWLHEGSNGFLAPANPPTADGLAAAIAMCLNDPYRYRQLRLGARVEALKFGLEQHVDSLLQILTAAAGEAPACTTERSQQTFSQ